MAQARDIKYLNKDFAGLRQALVNYSKTYFPTTYTDFTEASPGMMFMEQSAYIGDVLSFYQDSQINETFVQYANNIDNLYELSYVMGYRPKVTGVASTLLDFYQTVPAISSGGSQYQPDYRYALLVQPNAEVKSNTNNQYFITENPIDFTVSSSANPTSTTIFTVNGNNNPETYLLKKSTLGISSTVTSTNIFAGATPQEFFTTTINAENIVGILDIIDEDVILGMKFPI